MSYFSACARIRGIRKHTASASKDDCACAVPYRILIRLRVLAASQTETDTIPYTQQHLISPAKTVALLIVRAVSVQVLSAVEGVTAHAQYVKNT